MSSLLGLLSRACGPSKDSGSRWFRENLDLCFYLPQTQEGSLEDFEGHESDCDFGETTAKRLQVYHLRLRFSTENTNLEALKLTATNCACPVSLSSIAWAQERSAETRAMDVLVSQ